MSKKIIGNYQIFQDMKCENELFYIDENYLSNICIEVIFEC
jgi:hypothetical protein